MEIWDLVRRSGLKKKAQIVYMDTYKIAIIMMPKVILRTKKLAVLLEVRVRERWILELYLFLA